MVKERSIGKLGIAIVDGPTGKVEILGAGIGIGNDDDDSEWMYSWQVYSKARVASEINVPQLRGDALLVEKSEAAQCINLLEW